mgnify:CR=1 FL=1
MLSNCTKVPARLKTGIIDISRSSSFPVIFIPPLVDVRLDRPFQSFHFPKKVDERSSKSGRRRFFNRVQTSILFKHVSTTILFKKLVLKKFRVKKTKKMC